MRFRYPAVLVLAGCLAATAAFAAAKPLPQIVEVGGEPLQGFNLGSGHQINAPCAVGQTGPPAFNVNYLLPPDDAYYTLVDPAVSCACPGNSISLSVAHVALQFPVICSQQVRVRVVPAIQTSPGCYEPDINTELCAPIFYNLAPGAAGSFLFNLPLAAGCCISGPAFLDINFITAGAGCNTTATRPRLITDNTPDACASWNVYPGGFDDLVVGAGFPGNPMMYADADCCGATDTHNHSWGRIKTLYR